MTDDLVKRLRLQSDTSLMRLPTDHVYVSHNEAADRIEELMQRVESSERVLNKIAKGDLRLAEIRGTKVNYSPADERLIKYVKKMEMALRKADEFISNGIAVGGIKLPDPEIGDEANDIPKIIRDALRVEHE